MVLDGSKYLLAISLSLVPDLSEIQALEEDPGQNVLLDDVVSAATEVESTDSVDERLNDVEINSSEATDAELFEDDEIETDSEQSILDEVVESAVGAIGALAGANIVPFRNSENAADTGETQLSGDEQEAFQAIAEALDNVEDVQDQREEPVLGEPEINDADGSADDEDAIPATEARDTNWSEIQVLIDKLPVACFVYRNGSEEGGEAFFASRAYLDLFGYETMETAIAAGGVAALLPVSRSPDDFTDDDQIMTITTAGGTSVPVLARLHAVNWQDAAAVMMTLTDRMPANVASAAPETDSVDLAKVFDEAFEAAIVLDEKGVVLHANVAATELFNLEDGGRDELTIADILQADIDELPVDFLSRFLESVPHSPAHSFEVTGKVYGGADIPLSMILRGQTGAEPSATYCATFTDISRWRNAADSEARARTLAEDANEQKSEFLSNISHEIRTSLNPVLGFSEAILEERFGPLEQKQYTEYVHNIHESGSHLLELVNDMLDLSKIEAGQAELNFASVDLNEVATGCVKLMQPDANKERIIIRSNLATNMPEIVADQQSLHQIGLNLLSNAVKYTGPGGQVIVSTRMTDAGEQQLRIRDTGRGMSDEELDTALRPFGRAKNVRADIEGTGLGLPLTHALIEANRARFSIESAAGEGTLVEVTFPVNRVLAS